MKQRDEVFRRSRRLDAKRAMLVFLAVGGNEAGNHTSRVRVATCDEGRVIPGQRQRKMRCESEVKKYRKKPWGMFRVEVRRVKESRRTRRRAGNELD